MTVVTIVLAVLWFGNIAIGWVRWSRQPVLKVEWHLLSPDQRHRQRAAIKRANAQARMTAADKVRAKAMADARAKMAAKR